MFSVLPPLSNSLHHTSNYAPQISSPLSSSPIRSSPTSPLSPRNANLPPQKLQMSTPTPTGKRKQAFSKRATKKNPLIHKDDDKETRRNLFLRRYREGSENRRWAARGGDDEIMRTVWILEQKRRAEKQAAEASNVPASQEEELQDEEDLQPQGNAKSTDQDMADLVAQQEDAEIEALLSMMDAELEDSSDRLEEHDAPETPYGSDEDEYDHLFMDVIKEEETKSTVHTNLSTSVEQPDEDMMDIN